MHGLPNLKISNVVLSRTCYTEIDVEMKLIINVMTLNFASGDFTAPRSQISL